MLLSNVNFCYANYIRIAYGKYCYKTYSRNGININQVPTGPIIETVVTIEANHKL